jgi:hypothetical protein
VPAADNLGSRLHTRPTQPDLVAFQAGIMATDRLLAVISVVVGMLAGAYLLVLLPS